MLPLLQAAAGEDEEPPGETAAGRAWAGQLLVAGGGLGVFGVLSFVWGQHFQNSSIIDPDKIPIHVMLHADTIDWGGMIAGLLFAFFSRAPATGSRGSSTTPRTGPDGAHRRRLDPRGGRRSHLARVGAPAVGRSASGWWC